MSVLMLPNNSPFPQTVKCKSDMWGVSAVSNVLFRENARSCVPFKDESDQ